MYTILTVMDAPAREDWYMRKLAMATGPAMRRIHCLNLPSFPGLHTSTIRPIVISVNASTTLAARNRVPTAAPGIPSTFI